MKLLNNMMSRRSTRKQSGFTMVELAVVLVVAGLILVAVLKGTDTINKAKAERAVADLKGLQGMILETQKRVNRLPGDCNNDGIIALGLPIANNILSTGTAVNVPNAVIRTPGLLGVCGTAAQVTTAFVNDTPSTIIPTTATAGLNTFPDLVYNEMRRAGVVDGHRTNLELAKHNNQDVFLIGAMQDNATATVRANVIVMYGIPVWMAEAIEAEIDGVSQDLGTITQTGPANTGRVRRWSAATTAAATGTALPVFAATATSGQYDQGGLTRDDLVSISYQFDTIKLQN